MLSVCLVGKLNAENENNKMILRVRKVMRLVTVVLYTLLAEEAFPNATNTFAILLWKVPH
jgi:hypothetical protein